jgi:AAA family ATP:ADP antiporter
MAHLLARLSGASVDGATGLPQPSPHERAAARWAFLYFFALLASYYVLRPIRDEMAVTLGGSGSLHVGFAWVFAIMLGMVPLFGLLTARFPRLRLLPYLYGFFGLNLLVFYGLFGSVAHETRWLARAFFVWVSVFNLFAVSIFWSLMADLFSREQAERLYGFIAAGGTCGALAGPALTASLVGSLGPRRLLLVSAGLLALAIFALLRLRTVSGAAHPPVSGPAPTAPAERAMSGSLWSGLWDVLRSPYLLGICLFLLCYSTLSTFLYFQQAELVPQRVSGQSSRILLFAQADFAVNLLTLVLQVFAFKRAMARLGTGLTLALLPLLSILGFSWLASSPGMVALLGFGILRRAGEFALSKPARETLFNALPVEQKYRAKNVIDTLVHRAGDASSAWLFDSLRGLGMSLGTLAWCATGVSCVWLASAVGLGRAVRRSTPSQQ